MVGAVSGKSHKYALGALAAELVMVGIVEGGFAWFRAGGDLVSVTERTRKALKDFGLTEYEAKAYISLVEGGSMPASELSKVASVPYSKVYEVLGNLERKGWIESEQGRPSKYYAKSPSTALESSRMRMENVLKVSEGDAMEELQPLYEKKGLQERPDIWIVRGQNNILDKIRESIGRTRRELLVAMPVVPDSIVAMAEPLVRLLKDRGIKVSMMIPQGTGRDAVKRLRELAEVRLREQMFGGGIISDNNQIILLLGEEPEKGLTLAISSDHLGLVKFGKSYFEYLWENSKPAS